MINLKEKNEIDKYIEYMKNKHKDNLKLFWTIKDSLDELLNDYPDGRNGFPYNEESFLKIADILCHEKFYINEAEYTLKNYISLLERENRLKEIRFIPLGCKNRNIFAQGNIDVDTRIHNNTNGNASSRETIEGIFQNIKRDIHKQEINK
ncbi:hypothetical protein C8D76_11016 [Pasteurella langaaensis DSM 22999]|uniref:Uncharacterized protein n=1 Tax=Alitibacter langaaensis DSM 22999 TaxID=1122935 RepID=A0A2U0SNS8_9PAST|nr:hypothetical protein [Pasteurella langaaensis]PVX32991.1 hypothetical protein C8D76_11016 [Pasteurella langaaensis DSM 22999]